MKNVQVDMQNCMQNFCKGKPQVRKLSDFCGLLATFATNVDNESVLSDFV